MATKQEVLSAIASGYIFTDEYQSREIQIKIDKMCDRLMNQKKSAERHQVNNVNSDDDEVNPYAGKRSGDYVGD